MHPLITPDWSPVGKNLFIASTVNKVSLPGDEKRYEIFHPDPIFSNHLADYLAARAPFNPEEEARVRAEDYNAYTWYLRDRRKFWRALRWLSEETMRCAISQFIAPAMREENSRMGDRFSVAGLQDIARIGFVDIARGGSPPTLFSREYMSDNFNLLDDVILWVGSEREVAENGDASARQNSKTVTCLDGRQVFVNEQILATGTSAKEAVQEAFRDCIGKPEKIIFTFFAATRAGIEEIAKDFPDAGFIVMSLHEGMNAHRFVIGIGAGDAGAQTAGGIDRKTWLRILAERNAPIAA